jgi:hypothetical protein
VNGYRLPAVNGQQLRREIFDGIGGIFYDMIWLWVFDVIDFRAGLTGYLR